MKMLDSLSVQAAAAGAVVAGLAGIAPGQLCPPEPVLVGGKFEISTGTGDVRDQPVVAYNGTSGEFLVAWFDNRNSGNIDIFARRVATDGTLPADAVEVSGAIGAQFDPALAHNSVDNEYLVAWRSQDGDQFTDPLWNNAIGVRLDGSGNRMGGDLPISAAGFEGSLVHSAASNSYFHLGRNFQGGGAEGIVSQLVSAGGALQGSRIDTATGAFPTPGPAGQAGYDSVNHRFLATWREQLLPRDLRGQLYDGATGGAVGASFRISDVFASGRDLAAGVAFDPGRGRFLVVFGQHQDDSRTSYDVLGQFVSASGVREGGTFVIADLQSESLSPFVAFSETSDAFVVVWNDGEAILAKTVSGDGTVNRMPLSIAAVDAFNRPRIARNPANDQFLVVWPTVAFQPVRDTIRGQFIGLTPGDCPCPVDLDASGDVDVFDLLAYLDLWFMADAAADIDGTAGVDVFDLLAFLDGWFAGCP